jgi:Ran GTPase-activating protein (RanGAP) involved in mRNA processing and transport
LSVLSEPETSGAEVRPRVREYLASLTDEQREVLEQEALGPVGGERLDRMKLLWNLGFTSRERHEYSKYKLSSPQIRAIIARRALLAKRLGCDAQHLRLHSFFSLANLEATYGVDKVSVEEAIKELRDGR